MACLHNAFQVSGMLEMAFNQKHFFSGGGGGGGMAPDLLKRSRQRNGAITRLPHHW